MSEHTRTTRDVEFFFVAGMTTAGTRPHIARAEFRDYLAAHDAQVKTEALAAVVTPEAREHWERRQARRERWGGADCVCLLCGVMSRIEQEGAGARIAAEGGEWE